jgi:tetratricopeptide (TPR) repeat protein
MYKTRLREWGYNKNVRSCDWDAVAILHQTRKENGKKATEFFVHGKKKTVADLHAHVRSLNKSVDEFLASAIARGCAIPPHVRCQSPESGAGNSPSRSPPQDAFIPSPASNSYGQQLTPNESTSSSSSSPPHSLLTYPQSTDPTLADLPNRRVNSSEEFSGQTVRGGMDNNDDFILVLDTSRPPSEVSSSSSSTCDQIEQDVRTMALQLFKPANLISRIGADDMSSWVYVSSTGGRDNDRDSGESCLKCDQAILKHVINLVDLAPSTQGPRSLLEHSDQPAMILPASTDSHGEAWRWIAFCFASCMAMSRGDVELSDEFLDVAAAEFEEMLAKHDCLILTGLNLMLSILHMHDQASIAESVVHSALKVAERVRPADDPIRVTIEWMTTVAARKLEESGSNGEVLTQLESIYEGLKEDLGGENPSTLAALYNFAWMLCFEERLAEAEQKLHQLYASSSSSLGPAHMQSITALTTLSRAQASQGNYEAAIQTIKTAIRDSKPTLGRSHPHRLESKRRLALMYREIGEISLMEEPYWDVLKGRIKMLGPEHSYTKGMRLDLVELLKELGKWNEDGSTQASIDELYTRPSPATSQHRAF